MKDGLAVEYLAIEALVPYANNARTHSPEQVAQIAASIREFRWTNPILIDRDGGIVAGHGRVLAARRLGMAQVPCIRLDHLTPTQRRALVLADNKLALNAGWDDDLLKLELEELQSDGFGLDPTGFSQIEIDMLLTDGAFQQPTESSAREIDPDSYAMGCKCPRCGFEFDAEQGERADAA